MRFLGTGSLLALAIPLVWGSLAAGLMLLGVYLLASAGPGPGLGLFVAALCLTPFALLGLIVLLRDRAQRQVWQVLSDNVLAMLVLDSGTVAQLRWDLQRIWYLNWSLPPTSRSMQQQLKVAAIWLTALSLPGDSPLWSRFGEIIAARLAGLALVPLAALAFIAVGMPRWGVGSFLILLGSALAALAYAWLLRSARMEALSDFHLAWKNSYARFSVEKAREWDEYERAAEELA